MSLQEHLDNLRSKPRHIRKQIAFWSSLAVTAMILAFWVGSFSGFGNKDSEKTVTTVVNKAGSPVQSLVASVGTAFGDLKDLIFGPRKITYSSVEVLPSKTATKPTINK